MKAILRIVMVVLLVAVLLVAGGVIYLQTLKPRYAGTQALEGLQAAVEVFFDDYGIPHIYAQNEHDAYFALGYLHAQERLFQMEMLRRVAAGRLAEILGEEFVPTDRFFRTLGIAAHAAACADAHWTGSPRPFQKAASAYLDGINQFVGRGPVPLEFRLLGIPRAPFTPQDIYLIGSFIAFGFAEGFALDPLVTKVYQKLGWPYIRDWALHVQPGDVTVPPTPAQYSSSADHLPDTICRIRAGLPLGPWLGSNGWAVGPQKTAAGRVLLANDTHMQYAQPAIWYEAHLAYPGFNFYGNHAAGFPFALVGHNQYLAWGLTMFENDDVDFYRERRNPANPDQVWFKDHWEDLSKRQETIKVKDGQDITFTVRHSRHGPLINEIFDRVPPKPQNPVAVWWSVIESELTTVEAFYAMAHAQNLDQARAAAAMIDAPGLNVIYGDSAGNIAWWAAARLVKRPAHVNSKLFLDGTSGRDEPLGFYAFEQNPQVENPPWGFVFSANNQPAAIEGRLYPGYYVPEDRARRIMSLLLAEDRWSLDKMRQMSIDGVSPAAAAIAGVITEAVRGDARIQRTRIHQQAWQILQQWNGDHQLAAIAPTVYYRLIYFVFEAAMADELGMEDFNAFMSTHLMKRSVRAFVSNDASLWWDDIRTLDVRETRRFIFIRAFEQTIDSLRQDLGEDITTWHWARVHTLEHGHVLGRKKPFDYFFNVGPFPTMGGNEVINNMGFRLAAQGTHPVVFGPAMRILLDFGDLHNSLSINPTGQSGYFMSPHYDDQALMFCQGKFRKQLTLRQAIATDQHRKLQLLPE